MIDTNNAAGDTIIDSELRPLTGDNITKVGIVGMPPLEVIRSLNKKNIAIYDLDTQLVEADMESTVPYLPRVYCAILRTVVLNALHLAVDTIYIDVGPGKCDCALQVATVLEDILTIPVIKTRNKDTTPFGTTICRSAKGLQEKFLRITEGVKSATTGTDHAPCQPSAGFWGVPPRDLAGPAAWKTRHRRTGSLRHTTIPPFPLFSLPSRSVPKPDWPIIWPPTTRRPSTLTAM
jgi:hypothetical protein